MSRSRVFEWHKCFVSGCMEEEDAPRSGSPFFTRRDWFIIEFVPEGQKVNQHFNKHVLSHLHDRVRHARPAGHYGETSPGFSTMTVHPHTFCTVRQFLAQKQTATLDHPPYGAAPSTVATLKTSV